LLSERFLSIIHDQNQNAPCSTNGCGKLRVAVVRNPAVLVVQSTFTW
jgi:hypothetical protein